jgi:hypothetical protein
MSLCGRLKPRTRPVQSRPHSSGSEATQVFSHLCRAGRTFLALACDVRSLQGKALTIVLSGGAENAESKVSKEKLQEVLREFELDDDVNKVGVICPCVCSCSEALQPQAPRTSCK